MEPTEIAVNALVPLDDHSAMVRYCDENERSKAWFVRTAIKAYLEHLGYRSA